MQYTKSMHIWSPHLQGGIILWACASSLALLDGHVSLYLSTMLTWAYIQHVGWTNWDVGLLQEPRVDILHDNNFNTPSFKNLRCIFEEWSIDEKGSHIPVFEKHLLMTEMKMKTLRFLISVFPPDGISRMSLYH